MSDTKTGDDKTLSVNTKKTLTLKRPGIEQSTVRQNFSHGRTKSVVVETKKRKFVDARREAGAAAVGVHAEAAPVAAAPAGAGSAARLRRPVAERPGLVLNDLSAGEIEARRRALEGSKVREVEDRQRAIEEAKRRARRRRAPQARARGIRAPPGRGGSPPAGRGRIPPPRRGRGAPPRAARRYGDATTRRGQARRAASGRRCRVRAHRDAGGRAPGQDQGRGRPPPRQADAELRRPPTRRRAPARCRRCAAARKSSSARCINEPREKVLREVILPETITIQELASRMSERAVDVVKFFMKQGQIMKPGDVIDADTAELVASEFGHTVRRVAEVRHRGRPVQRRGQAPRT